WRSIWSRRAPGALDFPPEFVPIVFGCISILLFVVLRLRGVSTPAKNGSLTKRRALPSPRHGALAHLAIAAHGRARGHLPHGGDFRAQARLHARIGAA